MIKCRIISVKRFFDVAAGLKRRSRSAYYFDLDVTFYVFSVAFGKFVESFLGNKYGCAYRFCLFRICLLYTSDAADD